jgi:hypothetical protein
MNFARFLPEKTAVHQLLSAARTLEYTYIVARQKILSAKKSGTFLAVKSARKDFLWKIKPELSR